MIIVDFDVAVLVRIKHTSFVQELEMRQYAPIGGMSLDRMCSRYVGLASCVRTRVFLRMPTGKM